MKRFALLLMLTLAAVAVNDRALAQSQRVKDAAGVARNGEANKPAAEKLSVDLNDARTAAQLFEDADKYTERKFAEFEKRRMPFDARLSDKIKQEQRDLAASYAALLAARRRSDRFHSDRRRCTWFGVLLLICSSASCGSRGSPSATRCKAFISE